MTRVIMIHAYAIDSQLHLNSLLLTRILFRGMRFGGDGLSERVRYIEYSRRKSKRELCGDSIESKVAWFPCRGEQVGDQLSRYNEEEPNLDQATTCLDLYFYRRWCTQLSELESNILRRSSYQSDRNHRHRTIPFSVGGLVNSSYAKQNNNNNNI